MAFEKHILVVDDEEIVRTTLNDILSSLGYRVTCLQDGGQAKEVLQEQTFDLIICDIAMPKLDGIALLDHLQSHNTNIPIVMVLGSTDAEIKQHALNLGAKTVLEKPISIKDLQNAIITYM